MELPLFRGRFTLAEKVVELYALRMRIEEAFRDLKSTRFGLRLELHHTYQLERLLVLLLIATLALMVAWIIGKATEHTGQHRHLSGQYGARPGGYSSGSKSSTIRA